jgi:hypothetical protein
VTRWVLLTLSFGTIYYVLTGGVRSVFWFGLLVCTTAAFVIGFITGRGAK